MLSSAEFNIVLPDTYKSLNRNLIHEAFNEVQLLLPESLKKDLPTDINLSQLKFSAEHIKSKEALLKILIHEIAHLYDQRMGQISKSPEFYIKAGFKKGMLGIKNKNKSGQRPITDSEMESAEEAFAINLEYFLLDADYRCRRPVMYEYLAKIISAYPNVSGNCLSSNTLYVSTHKGPMPFKIDFDRLYRIDYLLAAPGRDISSGFGHSMFRLVICSPSTPFGPRCLQDKMSHLVISYRASIEEPNMNYLKGLLGGYPSILFILNFADVLHQYNAEELRDVIAFPLVLNSNQRKQFIYKVLEEHWSYRGDYKFISNNCAVESLNLFKAAIENTKLSSMTSITPNGVLDVLKRTGFISQKDIQTDTFPAKLEQLFLSYHEAYNGKKDKKNLFNFIDKSLPEERLKRHFEIKRTKVQSYDMHTELILRKDQLVKASALSVLEQQIQLIKSAELKKKMAQLVDKDEHAEIKNIRNKYEEKLINFSKAKVEPGYGIPLIHELKIVNRAEEVEQLQAAMTKDVQDLLKEHFHEYYQEILDINTNIDVFNKFAIELRRQYKSHLQAYLVKVLFNLTLENNGRNLLLMSLSSDDALKGVRRLLDIELFNASELSDSKLRLMIAEILPN